MNGTKVIGGGLLAGIIFYALSLLVWALLKFLPVVPLAIAIPLDGLGKGWPLLHFLVLLAAGLAFAGGYAVYGKTREGGWLYGAMMFVVGILPAFVANFVLAPAARSVIVYGAVVSFIGALLAGKALSLVMKK